MTQNVSGQQEIDEQWRRDFDKVLGEYRWGAQFCDLDDESQRNIAEMAALGMSAEEVYDVLTEVEDVE